MLLSSCVVWRHLEWERFRAECPGGDERLQRLIWERLDESLAWLESLGAEPVWRDTENPLTTGRRYDPRALTRLLAREVELETPLPDDAEAPLAPRDRRLPGTPGARARASPAREPVERGRRPRLRTRPRRRDDAGHGRVLRPRHARPAGAHPRGGLRPARPALRPRGARLHRRLARDHPARGRVARERPRAADRPARVVRGRGDERPHRSRARRRRDRGRARRGNRRARRGCGHAHDRRACRWTCRRASTGTDGLWAAGVDAGGVATGGYASGLAQALVLGLVAAESIAAG